VPRKPRIRASKTKHGDDPIADYIEWTNNRYNPGYYLGGNIPPYLRKSSLGPKARRLAGIALAISAFLGVGSIAALLSWTEGFSRAELALSAAFEVLVTWAAVSMLRVGSKPSAKKQDSQSET